MWGNVSYYLSFLCTIDCVRDAFLSLMLKVVLSLIDVFKYWTLLGLSRETFLKIDAARKFYGPTTWWESFLSLSEWFLYRCFKVVSYWFELSFSQFSTSSYGSVCSSGFLLSLSVGCWELTLRNGKTLEKWEDPLGHLDVMRRRYVGRVAVLWQTLQLKTKGNRHD